MARRIASLLLAVVLCAGLTFSAFADQEFDLEGEYTSGAYTYTLNADGTATIVQFNEGYVYSALETLSIPSELDGHKVTALGTYSFSYYFPTGVKSVIIPEGVVSIGDSAFSCNNRETTSLVLPSTLETIGSGAFNGWAKLTTVVIPENVKSIGSNAFYVFEADENNGLKTVICYSKDVDFQVQTMHDNSAFSGCVDCTFYGYPGSTLDTLVNKYLTTRIESVMGEDGSWSEQEVSTGNKFADIANAPGAETPSESGDAGAEQTGDGGFSDVAEGIWYAEPVNWAVAQGITNGTSDTTFSPDRTCTRAQIITFLWRAFAE